MKYLIFVIIGLSLLLVVSVMITIIVIQRNKALKNEYTLLLQEKNKTEQSIEKYIEESEKKDEIIEQKEDLLKKIESVKKEGITDEEKINRYIDIFNNITTQ